ncbi:hypothetical protein [Capybara microvirus Cap1_SP_206]|nr:hypothetical protein [Capybara microvirus Cap1_SP_206]
MSDSKFDPSKDFELDDGSIVHYGDPRYIFDIGWNDESKKDFLIIKGAQPFNEVMDKRAIGTTLYELIDRYGGVDECSAAFSEGGVYADVVGTPEFGNNESYAAVLHQLKDQLSKLEEANKQIEKTTEKKEIE